MSVACGLPLFAAGPLKLAVGLKHYCVLDSGLSCYNWDGTEWAGAPTPVDATDVAIFSQVYDGDGKNGPSFRYGDDDGCYLSGGKVHCWGLHGAELESRFSPLEQAYLIAGGTIGVCVADQALGLRCDDGAALSHAGRPVWDGRPRIEAGGEIPPFDRVFHDPLTSIAIATNKVYFATKDGAIGQWSNGNFSDDKSDTARAIRQLSVGANGKLAYLVNGTSSTDLPLPKAGGILDQQQIGQALCVLYADKIWCSEGNAFADLKQPAALAGNLDRGCALDWQQGVVCAYQSKRWRHPYLSPATFKYWLPQVRRSLYRRKATVVAKALALLEADTTGDWQQPLFLMNALSPLFADITTADFLRRFQTVFASRLAACNRQRDIAALKDFAPSAPVLSDAGALLQASLSGLDIFPGPAGSDANQAQAALGKWLARLGGDPNEKISSELEKLRPALDSAVARPAARGLALVAMSVLDYLKVVGR